MYTLITGLLLWSGVHIIPAVAGKLRNAIIIKIGTGPYKGLFALLIITSIVCMVIGWRSVESNDIYIPAAWGRYITFVLVLIAFILFVAARRNTNIKRILRHPQLTGLILWSIGHLLSNGDNRSIILFSFLGCWAVLEMILINRRDGEWVKPEPVAVRSDVITIIVGCVLYTIFLFAHVYLSGVRII